MRNKSNGQALKHIFSLQLYILNNIDRLIPENNKLWECESSCNHPQHNLSSILPLAAWWTACRSQEYCLGSSTQFDECKSNEPQPEAWYRPPRGDCCHSEFAMPTSQLEVKGNPLEDPCRLVAESVAAAETVVQAPACTYRCLDERQGTGGGERMQMAGWKGACIAAALGPGLLEALASLGPLVIVEPLQVVYPPAN